MIETYLSAYGQAGRGVPSASFGRLIRWAGPLGRGLGWKGRQAGILATNCATVPACKVLGSDDD
jgi:hypothetical protein